MQVQKGEAGNLRFEAWYDGDDRLDVSIVFPNGTVFGPYASPASNAGADQQAGTGFTYYHRGGETDFSNADNGQRQILIDINGPLGTYLIRLTGSTISSDGSLFASLNPSTYTNNNRFLNQIFPGASINDYATAQNIIVPTDYVYDSTYVDLNGIPRNRNGGAEGDLWTGSSAGPTLDGRLGVDIAVPGELNIGAYSPDTYYSQFDFNIVEGSNGWYGLQNAVSAAAPILTGFIALMLEVNPNLNSGEVRSLLHQSARSDAFTGTVPNPSWGYGKLDALAAIEATQATMGLETLDLQELGFSFYPNPATELLFYRWENQASAQLELLDIQGRILLESEVQAGSGQFALPTISPGLYLLRLRTADGLAHGRVLIR